MELTPIEQMAKVSVAQIILRRRMRNSMNRLISEQAVIEAIKEWASHMFTTPTGDLLKLIKAIPSAEPKTGHWFVDERPESDREIICSNCEQPIFKYHKMDFDYRPKYCPNCGAKMSEPQESEG